MKNYWVIQSVALPSREAALAWRTWHHMGRLPGNELSRFKLFVRQDKSGKWRVIRKIYEHELDDFLLGDDDMVAQYREHLKDVTREARRVIKGRLQ